MPDAIWLRTAGSGSSIPIKTIVSNRLNISLQELACPVDKLPSCPVFIACSTSSASAPRHSPTITRFGLMRSAVLIRSRIVIGRTPSVLAFLVSNRTKLGLSINCSSAESSIVIIRSSLGINCDNAFKNVVFPEPVPPETKMLYPESTSTFKNSAASSVIAPNRIRSSITNGCSGNLRIEIAEPSIAIGCNTIFTLEPFARRVSTIGDASFTIRLLLPAIC